MNCPGHCQHLPGCSVPPWRVRATPQRNHRQHSAAAGVPSLPVLYSSGPDQVHVCFCVVKHLGHLLLPVLQSHLGLTELSVNFVILLFSQLFEGHTECSVAILAEGGKENKMDKSRFVYSSSLEGWCFCLSPVLLVAVLTLRARIICWLLSKE